MTRFEAYQDWYTKELRKTRTAYALIKVTALSIFAAGTIAVALTNCDQEHPIYKSHLSREELKMVEIFKDHGSSNPVEMAIAVCKTDRPALMAAIAIKESNGRPKAIGDSGSSKGAFQVQEKHWGFVSDNASEQALQAEKILEELAASSRGRLRSGLARYNGGDRPPKVSYRYADHVISLERKFK